MRRGFETVRIRTVLRSVGFQGVEFGKLRKWKGLGIGWGFTTMLAQGRWGETAACFFDIKGGVAPDCLIRFD